MLKTIAALAVLALGTAASPAAAAEGEKNTTIVLVHGAFVDGSGWAGVHHILTAKGYRVVVVQNPTTTLADDVSAVRRALAGTTGKVVLVGHSYGGVVITEAGTDPRVAALVYIAAFAPDHGESVSSLAAAAPPGAPTLPIHPPVDGTLLLDRDKFPAVFAADLAPDAARFMADSQQPWGARALADTVTIPAWLDKPCWFLIPRDDHVIPPRAQHGMAERARARVREVPGSHTIYVSNPNAVAALIEDAAAAVSEDAVR